MPPFCTNTYCIILYICQMLYAYVKKQRRSCPDTNSWGKYNFWFWGQRLRSYLSHECTQHIVWHDYAIGQKKSHKPYKFDLGQGQHHIGIMNVCDTSSHGDRPTVYVPNMVCQCQSKQKLHLYGLVTKTCQKLINLTLKSKVNVCIGIMNGGHTSSHGNRPMCQIWQANVK